MHNTILELNYESNQDTNMQLVPSKKPLVRVILALSKLAKVSSKGEFCVEVLEKPVELSD